MPGWNILTGRVKKTPLWRKKKKKMLFAQNGDYFRRVDYGTYR